MPVLAGLRCPLVTREPHSLQEAAGVDVPEIRAYKLGKKRWSYNQVEIILCEDGGAGRQLSVKTANHNGSVTHQDIGNNGVAYELTLFNDYKVFLEAYLVYDCPKRIEDEKMEWTLVERAECRRGCSGPILRAIQRFGKLGKRAWSSSPSPEIVDKTTHNMKDQRYLYLSFDEACTHVSCKYFRLVAGIWDASGHHLGSAATPPFRVLANNDVPNGAAHVQLFMAISSEWEGWKAVMEIPSFSAREAAVFGDAPSMSSSAHPSLSPSDNNHERCHDTKSAALNWSDPSSKRPKSEQHVHWYQELETQWRYLTRSKQRAVAGQGNRDEAIAVMSPPNFSEESKMAPYSLRTVIANDNTIHPPNNNLSMHPQQQRIAASSVPYHEISYAHNIELENSKSHVAHKRKEGSPTYLKPGDLASYDVGQHLVDKHIMEHTAQEPLLSLNAGLDDPIAAFVDEMFEQTEGILNPANFMLPYEEENFAMTGSDNQRVIEIGNHQEIIEDHNQNIASTGKDSGGRDTDVSLIRLPNCGYESQSLDPSFPLQSCNTTTFDRYNQVRTLKKKMEEALVEDPVLVDSILSQINLKEKERNSINIFANCSTC